MSWDTILSHDVIKRLWRAQLEAGTVSSASLLVGPDGIGKRRLALEMAKALNCLREGKRPCDACAVCLQISRGGHPDVHLLLPSGASSEMKIDDIRSILSRIALRPFSARMQVVMIDGAERLTEEAANSLLKALEEPSAHTRFILTTAHLTRCLPTIISRCQILRCQPLPVDVIERIVAEATGISPELATVTARISRGSASAAVALAQRWQSYEERVGQLAHHTPEAWITQALPDTRQDVSQWLEEMVAWLRDVAVVAALGPDHAAHLQHRAALSAHAKRFDVDRCADVAVELLSLQESLEQFVSPRLVASLAREQWLSLQQPTHV